ncbi:acyltransferase domain-containing protein [Streptomyces sp. NPDC049590]|uniref:acyltransferase domain-containing protein n=1 Tax=Streptomyces sp. NPDC049590 TaxID=3154834 RepID=UPI0034228964
MTSRVAVLFPGQGAYLPGVLAERLQYFPKAVEVLETVDAVAAEHGHEPVSPLLLERDAPAPEELLPHGSDRLDLAIYATNAAAFEVFAGIGQRADVLVGHSFGEFAALSAAGVVSVADVAHMACARAEAFQRAKPAEGGLVALDIPAWRAQHLIGLLDDPQLRLAIDNGPEQTVVSGPLDSLLKAEETATGLGFRATRLRAAYAFHNPLLYGAADLFRNATAGVELAEPRAAVFSPVLGRYVRTVADAREVIERNMVAPVRFYDALLALFRDGVRTFVEAGARQALTGMVRAALPPSAHAVPLLPSRGDVDRIVTSLTDVGMTVDWCPPVETAPSPSASTTADAPPRTAVHALASTAPEVPGAPGPQTVPSGRDRPHDRAKILAELADIYAEDLGFPAEMLTADIDLEADLGVDSVKQVALFQRVREQYGLSEPPSERRVRATTLEKIAELVEELRR